MGLCVKRKVGIAVTLMQSLYLLITSFLKKDAKKVWNKKAEIVNTEHTNQALVITRN